MSKGGKTVFVASCAIILVAAIAGHKNAVAKNGREICKGITTAQIAKVQLAANKMHLLPGRYGEITEVDERVWAELPRDSKTSVALAVYCSLDAGKTNLTLRGWRDGETKASIYAGNYMD
jgi:hypothetical protein